MTTADVALAVLRDAALLCAVAVVLFFPAVFLAGVYASLDEGKRANAIVCALCAGAVIGALPYVFRGLFR